nr:PREDICTED: uncharacterized protein LOC109040439 isoform X2 [Bemisia tabaci]
MRYANKKSALQRSHIDAFGDGAWCNIPVKSRDKTWSSALQFLGFPHCFPPPAFPAPGLMAYTSLLRGLQPTIDRDLMSLINSAIGTSMLRLSNFQGLRPSRICFCRSTRQFLDNLWPPPGFEPGTYWSRVRRADR